MKTTLIKIAPALMTLTALSACGGTTQTGLDTNHQPVVSRTDYTFDLRTSGDGLASGETRRLADWLDSMQVGYGDRISVDDPASYNGPANRNAIAAVVGEHGLLLTETAPVTTGAVPDGMIRVVVSRVVASVPRCPDWSRSSQPEYEASAMSNFGCASSSNLAAMVASPEDLIRGREGSVDPRVSSRAIQSFRNKAPTGAGEVKAESSKGN